MNWETELARQINKGDGDPIEYVKSLLKKERIDENKKWMIKSCQEGHDFEGYCEGDFLNRISELEGGSG